jgi:hypothetical protein
MVYLLEYRITIDMGEIKGLPTDDPLRSALVWGFSMNIFLLLFWLLPLAAGISAAVIVATDKRVRHGQGHSISR